MKYFAASLVIAIAAAVYGLFSHGVYSYFMIYAFMIPLLGGALPHLIAAMKGIEIDSKDIQLAIIATLTIGSILKGVLDIYGTTNRLLIVYPVIAMLILSAAIAAARKNRSAKGSHSEGGCDADEYSGGDPAEQ